MRIYKEKYKKEIYYNAVLTHELYDKIQVADIFTSANPMTLNSIINFFSSLRSSDKESEHSHSGFFTNLKGISFEIDWKAGCFNFAEKYEGKKVLIGRFLDTNNIECEKASEKIIEKYKGQIYPVHRLILHALNVAHIIHWQSVVCSEATAELLFKLGGWSFKTHGVSPDNIADSIKRDLSKTRKGPKFDIIFEGVMPINIFKQCVCCSINFLVPVDSVDCPLCKEKRALSPYAISKNMIDYNKAKGVNI